LFLRAKQATVLFVKTFLNHASVYKTYCSRVLDFGSADLHGPAILSMKNHEAAGEWIVHDNSGTEKTIFSVKGLCG